MRCPNRPRGFGKTPPSGGGDAVPTAGGELAAARRRGCRCSPAGSAVPTAGEKCRRPAAGAKGGKGTVWFPCPLLTPPNPPLHRDSLRSRGETGVRERNSGRQCAYGQLLGPEVSLRDLPRMTVRGQTVQGVCFLLRKAPLRSMVYSWSTKRPCGPLAFRRATEGSRVLRKGWGVKRGRETLVSLPLLPPPPGGGNARPAHRQPISPAAASRRNGGTAHPLLRVKAMGRQVASTGCAAVSAEGLPSAEGKSSLLFLS